MNPKEMKLKLDLDLPSVLGIVDLKTQRIYDKGENPYYDMQIENYILCPDGVSNWYGFIKDD